MQRHATVACGGAEIRDVLCIGGFQLCVECHVRSLQSRRDKQDTRDEKDGFNYQLLASHIASNLLKEKCAEISLSNKSAFVENVIQSFPQPPTATNNVLFYRFANSVS